MHSRTLTVPVGDHPGDSGLPACKGASTLRRYLPTVLVWLALALRGAMLWAGEFSEIWVFGDSWWGDSWCGGPTSARYLADDLDVPIVRNFAVGGCSYSCMESRINNCLASHTPDERTLLIPYGGIVGPLIYDRVDPAIMADGAVSIVSTLADAGGVNFVVPNLMPLGLVPKARSDFPGQDETISRICAQFNAEVDTRLQELETSRGLTIFRPDFYQLCLDIWDDPAAYGFTNLTDQGRYAPDPSGYFFWDTSHPTTYAHRVHADAIRGRIQPELAWDESGPGNWTDPHWTGDTPPEFPNERTLALIRTDIIAVAGDRVAREMDVESGGLTIESEASLTVGQSTQIAAAGSLGVAGVLTTTSLSTTGANLIQPGAVISVAEGLTVGSQLDVAASTLTTTPGVTSIHVSGTGALTVGDPLVGAELDIAGTVQTPGADVTVLSVTDNGMLNASADVTAQNLNVRGGAIYLGDSADLNVATMQVIGGTVNTGTGHIVVSDTLKIGDRTTMKMTDGTLKVNTLNLADPAVADNLTLCGGRLNIGGGRVPPDGAIAIWKFDEDAGPALDSSTAGNDHPGTLNGAERDSDDPDHPAALRFDRADGDDYVEVANGGDILFSSPFTIAMWIKTSEKGVELLGKGDDDGRWKYFDRAVCVEPGTGQVRFTSPLSGSILSSTAIDVANDEWHHVVVTFNGGTASGDQEIYVDTVNRTKDRLYVGGFEMGEVVRLGSAETTELQGYLAYDGLIDDVYLYDRALSAAEVTDLYQAFSSVLDPMPNTNLRVIADSTLHLETAAEEAILGDLALDAGADLQVTGAAIRFDDVTASNGSSIEGSLRVGGPLSPGDSPGVLSVIGELTMDSTSTYVWELGAGINDLVAVDGDLKLADGWTLPLSDAGGTCLSSDEIDLFTYTGSLTFGSCTIDGSQVMLSGRWDCSSATVDYDENDSRVFLTGLTVVPEPSSIVLSMLAAFVLVAYAWRRNR